MPLTSRVDYCKLLLAGSPRTMTDNYQTSDESYSECVSGTISSTTAV